MGMGMLVLEYPHRYISQPFNRHRPVTGGQHDPANRTSVRRRKHCLSTDTIGTVVIALTVTLAFGVGISLGLLGGGGSILTVPLLTYVAGIDARHAIAMSLLVVGVTSTVGAVPHARAGRVHWKVAVVFGLAAMSGAYIGGRCARFVPADVLLAAFAIIMLGAGFAMLRARKESGANDQQIRVVKILAMGTAVGVVSGLVGAGGGFLLVPALSLLAGLPMPTAVGTSLVVIAAQSYAGLAGHLADEAVDWQLAAMVITAAVTGALVGGRLIRWVDPSSLRRAFGWLVLLMASLVLAEEVHPAVGAGAAAITLAAAATSLACNHYSHCPLHRLARMLRERATAA